MLPPFFYVNLSSLSGIATALLCVQFADSAGNIAAGALIQTNTLYYGIF
jgi:hypothetical protein